jgi:hypothetical protein
MKAAAAVRKKTPCCRTATACIFGRQTFYCHGYFAAGQAKASPARQLIVENNVGRFKDALQNVRSSCDSLSPYICNQVSLLTPTAFAPGS